MYVITPASPSTCCQIRQVPREGGSVYIMREGSLRVLHAGVCTRAPLAPRPACARAPSAWVANRGSAAHRGAGRPVVGARVAVGHTPALLAVSDRLRAIPRASARDMAGPRPPQIRHSRDVGRDSRDASAPRDTRPPECAPFLDCVSSSIELGVSNAGSRACWRWRSM